MLQEKRDQHRPHQTKEQMMQEGTRILPSWGSQREDGAAVVARHREDREDGTAVLRGHHDRTGDLPPPTTQRHRDLGFGLGSPPPHPRPM
jgi:hypothetical protein